MENLHAIPLKRKLEAFERVKAETNIDDGYLILLTEEYFEAGLDFARDSFTKEEPINHAVNTQWFPELAEMWSDTFRCHLTIAVLSEATGKIIAIRGTRVLDKTYHFDCSHIEDPGFKILFGIIGHCDERAGFFERFGVEQAFQFFGFGVDREFRNRGIGGKLFKAAIKFLQYACPGNFCIKGETSSKFSSKIYEKNGFEMLYEKAYTDYLVDGKQVICDTGVHKALRIYGLRVGKQEPTHN